MSSLLRAPAFARLRGIARDVVENNVERPILHVARTRSSLKSARPTIIHVGDSSMLHISSDDSDRRRLGEMMADALQLPTAQFYGPGYSAALFAELVRLIAGTPPACVVVSLGVRTSTHSHVTEHPVFGYRRAIQLLTAAKRIDAALLARSVKRRPTTGDYAAFEQTSRTSQWNLASSIGAYRAQLRDYNPADEGDQRQTVLFDYFHGEFSEESERLADWTLLGERLRVLGVPVVAYRSWMPVQNGTRLLGESFSRHVATNFAAVERAFFGGLGAGSNVELEPLPDDCFVNPADGTEHLNQRGRLAVVDAVAPAVLTAVS